ncbi:MAG: EAL domain-containing protein [Gammaproteobacteria bacterium]|nr:EAL domain-containing protein [Gammaproteobacteria bacterium]
MYYAKNEGPGNFKFYAQNLNEAALENITLEHELRNAMSRNELIVYYQPKVGVTGQIVGAEALLRWRHPLRGLLPPGKFIPLAEQTGLIADIELWVFEQVCRWIQLIVTNSVRNFRISVNISAIQFKRPDFIEKIAAILTKTRANPFYIELELTESISIGDIDTTIHRLNQLKNLGLTLAMDDFGTGFSSLSYLEKLPLDVLKIDQSFVRALDSKSNGQAIVQTIIALAKGLEMEVIAEGVETQAQFELLKRLQCPVFQGYLFGKPLTDEDFLTMLLKNSSLLPAAKYIA